MDQLNIVNSTVAAAGASAPSDTFASESAGMRPDTSAAGGVPGLPPQNLNQNDQNPSPGVSCAGPSGSNANPATPRPDTPMRNTIPLKTDKPRRWSGGSAEDWTPSQRLEFITLWLAIELSVPEIAEHFGLAERHLQRLRADYGLETRTAIRRLGRAARQRLVSIEVFAAFITPKGQALLRLARTRRETQDQKRAAREREEAQRLWAWRRRPPPVPEDVRVWRRAQRQARRGLRLF